MLICIVLIFVAFFFWRGASTHRLPPGPPRIPILGNLLQVPRRSLWEYLERLRDKYGPISSFKIVGQVFIIINSRKVATELLDKRANIYSDRPPMIMAGNILTGGLTILFSSYNDYWRKLRRVAHEGLNAKAAESYHPIQEREAATLAEALIRDADDWDYQFKRTASSIILTILYGFPSIKTKDDSRVLKINKGMEEMLQATLPGAYMVETFPWMMRLPRWMTPWRTYGEEWHRGYDKLFVEFTDYARENWLNGSSPETFSSKLLEFDGLSKREAAWLSGTLFAAGSETTAAVLSVFLLAMVRYPDVQRRAQAEIDSIVGSGRPPSFQDYEALQYVRAIVKETLRWRPVTPVGFPRYTSKDDFYAGYLIPKGSIVIYNTWSINKEIDATTTDSDEFRPERFLDACDKDIILPDTHGQNHSAFGFGKRICSGYVVANNSLFILFATLLWATNLGPRVGTPLPSKDDFVDAEGLVARPRFFQCTITPRHQETIGMLVSQM